MTTLPAISLWQPSATLIATRQPCGGYQHGDDSTCRCSTMVKRFETRSRPCPPKYIGQRVAIHAAKRRPRDIWCSWQTDPVFPPELAPLYDYGRCVDPQESNDGEWWRHRWAGPLGAVVATAVITASLPILRPFEDCPQHPHIVNMGGELVLCAGPSKGSVKQTDISDQLPYGDFTPGRYAWALADVEPVDPPVPTVGRQGWFQVELP